MYFLATVISLFLLTGCLSVGRSDGARTLEPGQFEVSVQLGTQDQDYEPPNPACGLEGKIACNAQQFDPEAKAKEQTKKRKDSFSFTNGVVTLQALARVGIVSSLDAGVFVSMTGIGFDIKKNWLNTEPFALATSVTGMTNIKSSVESLGDSSMSSLHLSLPMEANFQVPHLKPTGVLVVSPLIGYYWKKFNTTREDAVAGAQAMVGIDSDAFCRCRVRFSIHSWYLQPRQIGLGARGASEC